MPLFRALAKNMAASYFGKNYLTVFPIEVRPLYVLTLWQRLRVRDSSCETHAVCLRHPVLTRKSRSRRQSENEIVEKSRSPHDDFSKNKESWLFFVFQK